MKIKNNLLKMEHFQSSFKNVFMFNFEGLMKMLESSVPENLWVKLKDWEDLEDLEIFQMINDDIPITGSVYIITELSYNKNFGPFYVGFSELEKFVVEYLKNYGECFFNGDVLIVDMENKNVWAFHHEGVFTHKEIKKEI